MQTAVIKGKRVLVFGLARSGTGAANLLSQLGAEVTITDRKSGSELMEYAKRLSNPVKLCLGGYPANMNGTDMIVISPGVPLNIGPLLEAKGRGIKVIGELELAYQAAASNELQVAGKDKNPSPAFLAITGTNGKSTTTTLLDLMLKKGGLNTLLGGNIGNALCEGIYKIATGKDKNPSLVPRVLSLDFIVAEVSSFQLESIDMFKPKGAAVLNITPDHLDRYRSIDEYRDAKAAIFMNQDETDFLVLNADDPEVIKMRNERLGDRDKKPQVFYFSRQRDVEGAYYKDGKIYFKMPGVPSAFMLQPSSFRIKGVHNLENAMAAAAMALLAGGSRDAVGEALMEFPGLEHRLEFVREMNGVKYINDSKGTNVGAVVKSLEGFSEPIILIAGGRDKAGDFTLLESLVRDRVKALILIGEAAEKIKGVLGDLTETCIASDLKDAVNKAKESAQKGDVVLLSPACASFDMFMDFEDRGRQFKDIVMGLS